MNPEICAVAGSTMATMGGWTAAAITWTLALWLGYQGDSAFNRRRKTTAGTTRPEVPTAWGELSILGTIATVGFLVTIAGCTSYGVTAATASAMAAITVYTGAMFYLTRTPA